MEPYSSQFGGLNFSVTIDNRRLRVRGARTGDETPSLAGPRPPARPSIDDLASSKNVPAYVAVYRRSLRRWRRPFPLQLATQVDASRPGLPSVLWWRCFSRHVVLIGSSPGPYDGDSAWEIERNLGMAGGWQDHYAVRLAASTSWESRLTEKS